MIMATTAHTIDVFAAEVEWLACSHRVRWSTALDASTLTIPPPLRFELGLARKQDNLSEVEMSIRQYIDEKLMSWC